MREKAEPLTIPVQIELTPRQIAEAFASLGDEGQAQVIIEVAEIASRWTGTTFAQWYQVGRHLARCECSTDDARDLVRDIYQGIRHHAGDNARDDAAHRTADAADAVRRMADALGVPPSIRDHEGNLCWPPPIR